MRDLLGVGVLVSALSLALLAPTEASACSCIPFDTVQNYRTADHAFIGRVVGARRTGSYVVYDVRVVETAKSCLQEGSVVQVGGPPNQAACGVGFRIGTTYMVYADDTVVSGRTRMTTSLCMGSKPYTALTADDLTFLRARPMSCGGVDVCADGSSPVACLVDPCDTAAPCSRGSTCESNMCGGCTAEFYTPYDYADCTPW